MKKEQDKTKKHEGLYIEMRHAKLSTSSMKRSKCCVSADDCDATGHTLTWHIGVVESVDNERAIVSKLIQKYCNTSRERPTGCILNYILYTLRYISHAQRANYYKLIESRV